MKTFIALILTILLLQVLPVMSQDVTNITKQKPFAITGNLDLRGIAYSANGIADRRKPFSYIFSGFTNISFYGFEIPLSFSLSEQDRSFSQPFNQFGLSPKYKWLTLHGGYRNLTFSPYTLDGHTMLGAGIELNPKKFHLAVMYGRMNRATTVDTTLGTLQPFSFSRKGLAIKLGVGDERSFFTISVLQAKDDSSSVSVEQSTKQKVRAAANTVGSVAFRTQFFKHVYFEGDGGISLWTNDIGSTYAVPDSSEWIDKLRKIMPVNGTTEYSTAYRAALGYTGKAFGLKLEYKHVDPQFRSMGVYFFNNDIESYTINPTLNLFKGHFRLTGSIGKQSDNTKNQKEATTTRTIGMANLGLDITRQFGIDASFANFSSNSKPTVVLIQNKYLLAQNNNNLSITPRYVLAKSKAVHVIVASYNTSILTDDNSTTQTTNNINTKVYLLNYTLTLIKSRLGITMATNKSSNELSTGNFENMSYTLALNKSWIKGKLTTSLSGTYTDSKGPTGNSKIINTMFNASIKPTKHHTFSLRHTLLNNQPAFNTTQLMFSEHTGEAAYTYSF